MRFEVLGPLRAVAPVGAALAGRGERDRPLGGPKQRLVLALLLAEPNTTVSVERLIDGVWGDAPPESARHTLQSYVSELRKSVGDIIERDGTGYSIRIAQDGLDTLDFEARVSEALATIERDPASAVELIDGALAIWRGQPFDEFADQPRLQAEATRLDELRLAAVEASLRARLALGEHVAVVVDLERLTREYPYREELRALQMLALYRCGRQAEALRAFQATRAVLGEELGIDPSPRLRRLEEQILLQDPELDLAPSSTAATARSDARAENPYMGLRAFREADAARFFGHDRLVDQLARRVIDGAPFTAVVGPSGSGKSSAVQAGVLPRLRRDVTHLRIATIQPGSQPFAELDAAFARLDGSPRHATLTQLRASDTGVRDAAIRALDGDASRLLLVIDQFEELFTLTEPAESEQFVAALVAAAHDPGHRISVLVTMRADFYDRPLASPALGPLFAENVINVVPLGPEELEAAAMLPARQLDVVVDGSLVGRLIADVTGQPNALPLFQYALTELFDERAGSVLDLATYERIGGVRRAVARRAETLYNQLAPSEQNAVRQLFLRIATVSGAAVGRRRVPASELTALDVDVVALQAAIDSFARYRLLALDRDPTTGSPTVEVAHEALLAEWHRLRDWIDDSRDDLATHARFAVAVHEWEASGRAPGYLLTGSRLDDYERWAATSQLKLTETERCFIDEAIAARDAESAEDREREAAAARLRRRSRRQLVTLFASIAALAGVVAYPIIAAEAPPAKIAIALQFGRDQSAFHELLARGMESAAEEHGVEAVVLEPPYASFRDALTELGEDAELVFGTVADSDEMIAAAAEFPDTTWVFLDRDPQQVPNGVGVSFAQEQSSFLVGAAAALESETGRVGYIGANKSPHLIEQFRAGFEQGARAARPDVEIVASLIRPDDETGSLGYTDPDRARELAEWMFTDEDVDVVFTAAGDMSGRAVIEVATELSDVDRHLWAIGVDTDFVYELPAAQRDHLLTSMLKRFEVGIERVVAAHEDGTLEVPSTLKLGLADGAVGYSTSGDHLRASTITRLDELEAAIVRGTITVASTPTGLLREPPPVPAAPDTPETRAALAVAHEYFAAVNDGDVERAMAPFAPDATVSYLDVSTLDDLEIVATVDVAAGVRYVDVGCVAQAPPRGLQIVCMYGVHDSMARSVGAPMVYETATFTVEGGAITGLRRTVGHPGYEVVFDPFFAWIDAHHPEYAETLDFEAENLDEARRMGELFARAGAEWAEYLDAE
ncbi:MAG TPA: BTAD domain-containing putative transcriptional regulator, partial [Acidimicrobiia bacterium]|nr:BTAD domain-containing putative transcriptional regulator [Acidimicrobiia bacterium]